MRIAPEAAAKATPPADDTATAAEVGVTVENIVHWLEDAKAEDVIAIDIRGKSSIGDYMVIASGRTDRHVGAIGDQVQQKIEEAGRRVRVEGRRQSDWVLIDAGNIIIHVFRPEVREFYNLEKMWGSDWAADTQH
jgi:ribosome-associated protein